MTLSDVRVKYGWSCSYSAFTPKATGRHSFSMYAGNEEERPERRKLTDAQLYANKHRRDRGDSQLGADLDSEGGKRRKIKSKRGKQWMRNL